MSTRNYTVETCNRFAGLATDDDSETTATEGRHNVRRRYNEKKSTKKTDVTSPSLYIPPRLNKEVTKTSHVTEDVNNNYPSRRTNKSTIKNKTEQKEKSQKEIQARKSVEKEEDITLYIDENAQNVARFRQQQQYRIRQNNRLQSRRTLTGEGASIRSNHRVYDRISGTGRGKEMKRQGVGSHNWGNEIIEKNQGYSSSVTSSVEDEDHHTQSNQKKKSEKIANEVESGTADVSIDNEGTDIKARNRVNITQQRPTQKGYMISSKDYGERSMGRGRGFGRRSAFRTSRDTKVAREDRQSADNDVYIKPSIPVMLDLTDSAAFPTLA